MKLPKNALLVPVLAVGLTTSFIHAQVDGNWTSTATGNQFWGTATNWSSNPDIPGGANSTVRIESDITGATTVSLSSTTRTVGRLYIGDADGTSPFTIAASGTTPLVFDRTGGAEITMDQGGSNTISANITLDSNLTINNNLSGQNLLLSGVISGSGAIIKNGSGQLELNKGNTFTGGFTWNAGNLRLVQGTLGTGVWNINANNATLIVVNPTSTSSGMTNINLNANITVDVSTNSGSRFVPNDNTGITLTGGNRVITVLSDLSSPDFSYFESKGVTDNGAGYNLTKEGAGRMQYRGSINIGGSLFINGGTMEAMASSLLPTGITVTVNNGGTWGLRANSQTISTLELVDGSVIGANPALVATTYNLSSGTISKPITGTGSVLNKNTAGTVTISGNASYTGATAVNAGTLIIDGTFSNSSAITVAAGATLVYNSATARNGALTLNGDGANRAILGGTGTISHALTLNNIGDTLSPGSSPGIMPFSVSQTWSSFTYIWELNDFNGTTAGTNFDRIAITGSLNLTGGIGSYAIDITSLTAGNTPGNLPNFTEAEKSWTVLTTTTGITGFNPDHWTLNTDNFTSNPVSTGDWSLELVGNDLVLSYIPEPSSWVLLLVGFGALLLQKLRQKPAVNSFR